ncbi:hypothetical protein B0H13DRAFT_1851085 [Mycena leptocephala]|nr:hypothetical protein B0H13DRAFT_1851085 [Mycena leptocephala]
MHASLEPCQTHTQIDITSRATQEADPGSSVTGGKAATDVKSSSMQSAALYSPLDPAILSPSCRNSTMHLPQCPRIRPSRMTHLCSLYQDFIYIDEPTIGFLNMNCGAQTFTYTEYLSLVLTKIWAHKAILPGTATMWQKYEERVKERRGYGRHLQYLGGGRAAENIRFFVAWLNAAAMRFGGGQIDGESKDLPQIAAVWAQARYGGTVTDPGDPPNSTVGKVLETLVPSEHVQWINASRTFEEAANFAFDGRFSVSHLSWYTDLEQDEDATDASSFLPRYMRGMALKNGQPASYSRTAHYTEIDDPLPRPPAYQFQNLGTPRALTP